MHSRKPIQRDLSDNLDSLSQPYLEDQALILCDTNSHNNTHLVSMSD